MRSGIHSRCVTLVVGRVSGRALRVRYGDRAFPSRRVGRDRTLIVEDDWGSLAERDVHSGFLPATPTEEEPVLLVAT
jgi:hypothetical protein